MKQQIWHLLIVLVLLSLSFVLGCSGGNDDDDVPDKIAIYNGIGAWEASAEAVMAALDSLPLELEMVDESQVQNSLARFRLIIIPGGNPLEMANALGTTGKMRIQGLLNSGGGFIGISGGAYLAADTMIFDQMGSSFVDDPIDLYRGSAEGPINLIAPLDQPVMTRVSIEDSRFNISYPDLIDVLYYNGPSWVITEPYAQTIARLNTTGTPAAVIFDYGMGRVGLLNVHPEIEEDNPLYDGGFGHELSDYESDWFLLRSMAEWSIRYIN